MTRSSSGGPPSGPRLPREMRLESASGRSVSRRARVADKLGGDSAEWVMGIFSRIFNRPNADGSPEAEEGAASVDASATEATASSDAKAAAAAPDAPAGEPAPTARTSRGGAKKLGRSLGPLELSDSEFPPKAR